MTRRTARPRAYAPDPDTPGRTCDMPGCTATGDYRAPKSRTSLNEYWWFCLEHVRAYNLSWDFYKGMSPEQIEQQVRADTGWQRPTWPLGRLGARLEADVLHDPLDILSATRQRRADAARARAADATGAPSDLREPLAALGLGWPVTLSDLKTRYKELAKQHHPDRNGGDRGSEERLKTINVAYATLRPRVTDLPRAASG